MSRVREALRLKVYNRIAYHYGYGPIDQGVLKHSNDRGVVRLRTLTDSLVAEFENYAGRPVEHLAAPKKREPEDFTQALVREAQQAAGMAPETLMAWRGQLDLDELPPADPARAWFVLVTMDGKFLTQRALFTNNGFTTPALYTGETYHRSVTNTLHTIRRPAQ